MLPPTSNAPLDKGKSASFHPDDAIRSTDDDAAASRLSAVTQGYLTDPFLPFLYKPRYAPGIAGPSRKPPLINVGTHHRSYGIDLLVDQFLEGGGRQVISLGAGSDTRFFRIRSRTSPPALKHYVELDFPHLTAQKAQRIMRSPKLKSLLSSPSSPPNRSPPAAQTLSDPSPLNPSGEPPGPSPTISQGGTSLSSPLYSLLPVDLRAHNALEPLRELLDPTLSTLILAECVFCYMTPAESDAILRWFSEFRDAGVVIYEMCGLQDQFGQVMRRNLASRNLSLPGAVFDTPQALTARFLSPNLAEGTFAHAGAKSLWEIRERVIPPEQLSRISRLEHLDEIEELRLVLSHYAIAWASRGSVHVSL